MIKFQGCIEETNEPNDGSGDGPGGILGDEDNPNPSGADGGMDDGVTQEEMNLTCFNLMIDVLNSQMELQVCIVILRRRKRLKKDIIVSSKILR